MTCFSSKAIKTENTFELKNCLTESVLNFKNVITFRFEKKDR